MKDSGTAWIDHRQDAPSGGRNTDGQPFAMGNCGCTHFRIPALITLDDGSLLAATDCRWNHMVDGVNLETLVSSSADGGKTWDYRFVNYFGDSEDAYSQYAASFIDPALAQGKDGRVWLLTDLWPGSVTLHTGVNRPVPGCSGYLDADGDGEAELLLYENHDSAGMRTGKSSHAGEPVSDFEARKAWWPYLPEQYSFYAGRAGEDGFTPVFASRRGFGTCAGGERHGGGGDISGDPAYYVDAWYYLYDRERRPVLCERLAASDERDILTVQERKVTGEKVHANVFFYNSPLRVWPASYLWLVHSLDRGRTWSPPLILNPQVRRDEPDDIRFYGAGPGRGTAAADGRVLFACYTQSAVTGLSFTSVLSSEDGRIWRRSRDVEKPSSEAVTAVIGKRLYLFARYGQVCISRDGGGTWQPSGSWPDGLFRDCQLSAIAYSRPVGGRRMILLSGPGGSARQNGKIWAGFVREEETGESGETEEIAWESVYEVNTGGAMFAYSCLTELADGTVGLLYESGEGEETFLTLTLDEILGS